MCLGIPGRVTAIAANPLGLPMGTVSFGGISKEVCLACVPEARVGDYVLVHVGFALSRIDEKEAAEVFTLLEEMGQLADLEDRPPLGGDQPPGKAGSREGEQG